ncbi:MAG: amidohydrolase [Candidatus Binatia bacterium]
MLRFLFAAFMCAVLTSSLFAVDMSNDIDDATAKVLPQVIKWRRYIHEHPELSNREFNTSKLVADELRKLGLEVRTGIAKTGVVGILNGGQPGPVIGLRADMDALPVTERTDVPFKSTVTAEFNGQQVGVMHACGHDSHVAMLLGTATVLSGMKDKIKGTVVFIFQPAEEGAPAGEVGGADVMVKEGVMDNPKIDAIFGIHINAQTEIGKIGYKPGAAMASSDWFSIKVKGKQTHGAYPWLGIDPIAVATQIYTGLRYPINRSFFPRSCLTKYARIHCPHTRLTPLACLPHR